MSTIGTNAEDLILNADGSGSDIKFKSNGTEVGSISDGGVMTATSFAGSGAALTGVGVAGITSTADATAITIDSSENIGIGITTPSEKLHLYKTSSAGAGLVNLIKVQTDTNNTTGDGSAIAFHGKYGSTEWGFGKIGGANSGANYGGALEFHTNAGNGSGASVAYTKQLTITQDGRGLSKFTAKAWAIYSTAGTPSYWGSNYHNTSSFVDHAEGDQTINFANAMGSTQFAVVASGGASTTNPSDKNVGTVPVNSSSCRIEIYNMGGTHYDLDYVSIIVFSV